MKIISHYLILLNVFVDMSFLSHRNKSTILINDVSYFIDTKNVVLSDELDDYLCLIMKQYEDMNLVFLYRKIITFHPFNIEEPDEF